MSRIGKKPVPVVSGAKVLIKDHNIKVEGPKGKLEFNARPEVDVKLDDAKKEILVTRRGDDKQSKALQGLTRSIVNNMVIGVTQGYKKSLEIQGVGFKAAVQGEKLNLSLGKSHPILFDIPKDVKITVTDNTKIAIEGIDKHLVGQTAADIRAYYPPEPYKGKGIRYAGEHVRRKEGKTVQ